MNSVFDCVLKTTPGDLRSLNAQIEFVLRRAAQQAGRLKEEKSKPARR